MKLTQTQKYVLAGGGAAVLIAAAAAAVWFGRDAVESGTESESTATAEASSTVEPTATADSGEETATPTEQPLTPTLPSYGRYAHILSVEGVPGNYSVVVDFFELYTEDEADKYADEHGLKVPSNGILCVDEEELAERIPLRSDVVIVYKSGGVESLVQLTATVEQLREWTQGNTSALDGATGDQWDITVVQGVVTKIEMVAIAD